MKSTFDFRLIHPEGVIDQHVQAIWSAAISSHSKHVSKPLFSDGASGVFFNLTHSVQHDGMEYDHGMIYTPVKHQAEFINMSPGSRLVGFRFKPGVRTSAFGPIEKLIQDEKTIQYIDSADLPKRIQQLMAELTNSLNLDDQINLINDWLMEVIEPNDLPSEALTQLFECLGDGVELSSIQDMIPLSLRQLERQFKHRTGMTPKYYQRLIRVKSTIEHIKQNPDISLADLAMENGYSDQAHMTREFRQLAKMTPGSYQYAKKYSEENKENI